VIFCLGSSALFGLQDKLRVVLVAFLGGSLTLCLLAGVESLRILRCKESE
jgi:hypothetical protein